MTFSKIKLKNMKKDFCEEIRERGVDSPAPIINRQIPIIKQETTKFTFNT